MVFLIKLVVRGSISLLTVSLYLPEPYNSSFKFLKEESILSNSLMSFCLFIAKNGQCKKKWSIISVLEQQWYILLLSSFGWKNYTFFVRLIYFPYICNLKSKFTFLFNNIYITLSTFSHFPLSVFWTGSSSRYSLIFISCCFTQSFFFLLFRSFVSRTLKVNLYDSQFTTSLRKFFLYKCHFFHYFFIIFNNKVSSSYGTIKLKQENNIFWM